MKKMMLAAFCLGIMTVSFDCGAKEVDEYAGLDPETVKIVKECRSPEWDSGEGLGDYQMSLINMEEANCLKDKLAEYLNTIYTNDEKDIKEEVAIYYSYQTFNKMSRILFLNI